jgi:CBS domain containing-hemolysin-like protein
MSASDARAFVLAAVLVLLAGLLAAAESAFARVSAASVAALPPGSRRVERLNRVVADRARYVNVALFGQIGLQITAVVLVTRVALDRIVPGGLAVLVSALVMLLVSFVLLGVAPRTLGRQHALEVAGVAAVPVGLLAVVLGPVTSGLILLGNALTPGRGFREGPFSSEAELRELVDLAGRDEVIEDQEREMIHSVFELGDTLVREVMVPRPDMVVIEAGKTLRQAQSLALRSGFSRIPVVGENMDDIRGIVYLKDVSRRVFEHRPAESTERVESVMRPPTFVPDSKPVDELLREMQAQRIHVAVVVDEYGGTAGLVTIEDILEEIVGEITDEYDSARAEVEELPDGDVRVSARMDLEDFAERFAVTLDEDEVEDVDTVGGLLARRLGKVPIPGSSVRLDGWTLTAESQQGRRNRIGTVLLHRPARDQSLPTAPDAAEPTAEAADA